MIDLQHRCNDCERDAGDRCLCEDCVEDIKTDYQKAGFDEGYRECEKDNNL